MAPLVNLLPIIVLQFVFQMGSSVTEIVVDTITQPFFDLSYLFSVLLAAIIVSVLPILWTTPSDQDFNSYLNSKEVQAKGRFEEMADVDQAAIWIRYSSIIFFLVFYTTVFSMPLL